jgi:hypothetical protein
MEVAFVGGLITDEDGKFSRVNAFAGILQQIVLETECASPEPLRLRHVANEQDLRFASWQVFVVETLLKFVELFALFVYEKFEAFMIFDGEAVTPCVDPGGGFEASL